MGDLFDQDDDHTILGTGDYGGPYPMRDHRFHTHMSRTRILLIRAVAAALAIIAAASLYAAWTTGNDDGSTPSLDQQLRDAAGE